LLAALVVAVVILPESADPTAARVDTAGTLLGAGALAAFAFAIISSESAGFGSAEVIALLCASAVLFAAFIWREHRAEHPLLDLRFLRVPQFTTANIAAFCTYFATFAIFFFTALYLVEVTGASGYRLALVFLPMTVLMIASSLLAGRWTVRAGPCWSITTGCLLFAAGLLLTGSVLNPHPDYGLLMAALALSGIGIGTTVVPITSAVLSAVPPERSGMAASAANASREIGAVTGVAVLGSLVISQLQSSLTGQLNHLGIPAQFQALVVNAIETGQIPQDTSSYVGYGKIVQEVIGAAYTAFQNGLHAALYLSAGLALAAGLLAFITLRPHPAAARMPAFPSGPGDPDHEPP
jgi:predicted MFS family arabinose efflux permease